MAEKALAVIQEAYIQGISTRSVDDLVKASSPGAAILCSMNQPRRRSIIPDAGNPKGHSSDPIQAAASRMSCCRARRKPR